MHRERIITDPPTVTVGEGSVVLSRTGQNRKVTATVLGEERNSESGKRTIWLDRLIHRQSETEARVGDAKWHLSGAISTVLQEA